MNNFSIEITIKPPLVRQYDMVHTVCHCADCNAREDSISYIYCKLSLYGNDNREIRFINE